MNKKQVKIIRLAGCVFPLIILLTYIMPYANYRYKKVNYTVSGMSFVTGKTIAGGSVTFGTSPWILIPLIAAVVSLVMAILLPKMERKAGIVITVCSLAAAFCTIAFASGIEKVLAGAKHVSVSYGSVIALISFLLLLAAGVYILWQNKMVSGLDFMVLPGMMYFVINNYIPMVGIVIAFKKIDYSKGILASPWVGLDNFKMLFANNGNFFQSDVWIITRNTILYNLAFIVLGILTGIIVGICLADLTNKFMLKFFQTTILLPQLISMVIVAYIVYAFLSNETGMINHILGEENSINFYQTKGIWPYLLVFINIWKQIGYNAIIFLSSIVGIDPGIYEAAKVDGATKWNQIFHITLPLLKPTIITLVLLQVGRIFYSDFGLFYQVPLDSGALYNVTNTVDTYVYRLLMNANNISVSSAASTYQAVVGFILVLTVNLIVKKIDKDNALF